MASISLAVPEGVEPPTFGLGNRKARSDNDQSEIEALNQKLTEGLAAVETMTAHLQRLIDESKKQPLPRAKREQARMDSGSHFFVAPSRAKRPTCFICSCRCIGSGEGGGSRY